MDPHSKIITIGVALAILSFAAGVQLDRWYTGNKMSSLAAGICASMGFLITALAFWL